MLNNFARAAMTLFVHFNFLQSFHEYYLKFPNFTFYGGRRLKTMIFFFSFWILDMVTALRIQLNPKFVAL